MTSGFAPIGSAAARVAFCILTLATDSETEQDGRPERRVKRHERHAQDRTAEAEHRTHREIDAADDEHQRHARGDQGERRNAIGQRGEGAQTEKVVAQGAEEQDQPDPDDEQARVFSDLPGCE